MVENAHRLPVHKNSIFYKQNLPYFTLFKNFYGRKIGGIFLTMGGGS